MSAPSNQRTLILIPITHSVEDMGSLGHQMRPDPARRRQSQAAWVRLHSAIQTLDLNWPAVSIYQDGLPDTVPEIVQKVLAEVQSPNYDLLRWVAAHGAIVRGTESPVLLKEEYEHLRAISAASDSTARARARQAYASRAGSLLAERDAYIARRIDATLPPGGVGLLFIGQSHRVAPLLPADITVRDLPTAR